VVTNATSKTPDAQTTGSTLAGNVMNSSAAAMAPARGTCHDDATSRTSTPFATCSAALRP
jgi:hypothetical protein